VLWQCCFKSGSAPAVCPQYLGSTLAVLPQCVPNMQISTAGALPRYCGGTARDCLCSTLAVSLQCLGSAHAVLPQYAHSAALPGSAPAVLLQCPGSAPAVRPQCGTARALPQCSCSVALPGSVPAVLLQCGTARECSCTCTCPTLGAIWCKQVSTATLFVIITELPMSYLDSSILNFFKTVVVP
jgi:hypothetical protein